VHLRNSAGTGVQCQLFHSHFQDLGGEVMHLIGIREVGDVDARRVDNVDTTGADMDRAFDGRSHTDNDSVSTTRGSIFNDSDSLAGDSTSRLSREVSLTRRQVQREVCVSFQALRFTIRAQQHNVPVINASLLERESLEQWVTDWVSTRSWMQDFVNAALGPVNPSSWPSRSGPPSSLSFHVAFRCACKLPPDLLTRTNATGSGGADESPETRTLAAAPAASSAPAAERGPTRFSVSRVRLSRRRLRSPVPSVGSNGLNLRRASQVQPTSLGAVSGADPAGNQGRLDPTEEATDSDPEGLTRV